MEAKASPAELAEAFDGAAARYDLLNTLNPGYRRHLRMSAERLGAPPRGQLLDLCCGTGLSTEALVNAYPRAQLTALDASSGMLEHARRKPKLSRVTFLQGDATDPAKAGATGPYDAILMAYGIRNVPDRDACLTHLRQLLVPGGRIAFHEYSVADSAFSRAIWNAVATTVIVPLGTAATRSPELFRYLRESVNRFDGVEAFCNRLRNHGFTDVQVLPTDGWQRGVTHTFLAARPA